MDWVEVARGIIMADLFKAGIAFGILVLCGVAYAIACWLGK